MKLKLIDLVVRDVELIKRKYFHPNATASTHTIATVTIATASTHTIATVTIATASITTTATKAYATTINIEATTTANTIKTKDIKAKILGYTEII